MRLKKSIRRSTTTKSPGKNISLTDPAARWTAAPGGPAFYAYSTNYLIDLDAGIIVDVEATPAQAIVAVAFVGGTLGDQIFFWLGRTWGQALLDRLPRSERRIRRVKELLHRHHAPLIVGIRFMYGLRIVGPIVIGACEVPPWRFALFNMLGAAIWAPLVAGLGYLFGDALGLLDVDLKQFEGAVLMLIIAIAVAFSIVRRWRSH